MIANKKNGREKPSKSLVEVLWILGPVFLWFSYRPLIRIGQDETSYYEISLALIYCGLLAVVSLPSIWKKRNELLTYRSTFLTVSFVAVGVLTLFWTPNIVRGALTVGLMTMLWIIFLGLLSNKEKLKKSIPLIAKTLLYSGIFMSVIAIIQMIAGVWLSPVSTLLCVGCDTLQFGFARPNVFTIEPQFFGSLLLVPLLVALHKFINGERSVLVLSSLFLLSFALFLTMSRGAVLAFAVALVFLLFVYRKQVKSGLKSIAVLVGSFVLAVLLQGVLASVSPRVSITFYQGVSASLEQYSMGLIKFPEAFTKNQESHTAAEDKPAFDGYVEESTDIRVNLSRTALSAWSKDAGRMVFGAGIGSSGLVLSAENNKLHTREIVQNEYISTLLELGLVGLVLFVALLVGVFCTTKKNQWLWGIVIAYMVQWMFFSGYPNALHIYTVLMVIVAVSYVSKSRLTANRRVRQQ